MDSSSSSSSDSDDVGDTLLRYIQGIFSILSLVGSFFMIISMIFLKRTTKTHGRCLLFLACCQFALSLTYIATSGFTELDLTENHPYLCKMQGISIQFFNVASWVWTTCVAWNIWAQIVRGYSSSEILSKEKYMHIIAWFLALVSCGFIYDTIGTGDDNLNLKWCWAGSSSSKYTFMFFDAPLLVVLALNLIFISRVVYRVLAEFSENDEVLNGILSARDASKVKVFSRRIVFYPVVLIVCYAGALVNRISAFAGNEPVYGLNIWLSFMFLDGFLTAIVYGVSSSLITVYKHRWLEWKRMQDGLEFTQSRKSINEFIYDP